MSNISDQLIISTRLHTITSFEHFTDHWIFLSESSVNFWNFPIIADLDHYQLTLFTTWQRLIDIRKVNSYDEIFFNMKTRLSRKIFSNLCVVIWTIYCSSFFIISAIPSHSTQWSESRRWLCTRRITIFAISSITDEFLSCPSFSVEDTHHDSRHLDTILSFLFSIIR